MLLEFSTYGLYTNTQKSVHGLVGMYEKTSDILQFPPIVVHYPRRSERTPNIPARYTLG